MSRKRWTAEELELVKEAYESCHNICSLVKKLGRSSSSISSKASKMGFGYSLDNSEYILLSLLFKTLAGGKVLSGSHIKQKLELWQRHGFIVKTVKLIKRELKVIRIEDFWQWAYDNQQLLDFSRFEKNSLGAEPGWVADKRAHDISIAAVKSYKSWTINEEKTLISFCKDGYSVDFICRSLGRSMSSINNRLKKLNLPYRVSTGRTERRRWMHGEIEALKNYIIEGLSYGHIAGKLERSEHSVRGFVDYHYRITDLKMLKNIIKAERCHAPARTKLIATEKHMQAMADLVAECQNRISARAGK